MKYNTFLIAAGIASLIFASCEDVRTDGISYDLTQKTATTSYRDIVDQYSPLKSYVNQEENPYFRLGVGMDLDAFVGNSQAVTLATENFDEISTSYKMKHSAVVTDNGEYNFADIDNLLAKTSTTGMGLFGHTLVWHSGQNATYLNSLIAPDQMVSTDGVNLLDNAGLLDGSMTGWNPANPSGGITIEEGAGMMATSPAIKLVANETVANPWDLQLASPVVAGAVGHRYEISFFIKSDQPGQGRISFTGLNNNYPWQDWTNSGEDASETFVTTSEWTNIRFVTNDANGGGLGLFFDLGYLPNVAYYIDATNISVIDLDADIPVEVVDNLIPNGDFETGSVDPWFGWDSAERGVTAKNQGYGNTGYALYLTCTAAGGNPWDSQTVMDFGSAFEDGETYVLSFVAKASEESTIAMYLQETASYGQDAFGGEGNTFTITTDWTEFTAEITMSAGDRNRMCIHHGYLASTVYIDNLKLKKKEVDGEAIAATRAVPMTRGIVEMDKTAEEKKALITGAMEDWIQEMVTHCNEQVTAWDVVNEPMDDSRPYELKTGVGKLLAGDEFYWQDYMGKEYAATAFKLARQYAGENVKLFMNDYNLAYNLDKCRGIIQFMEYTESLGATVDGLGAQMHIDLNIPRTNIDEMLKLLAATGKLVRISELDIAIGENPTMADYLSQADLFRYVVTSYFTNVPADQRYGITVWGLTDSPAGSNWLPGQNQALFNLDYRRKISFKGFADGLAGREVVALTEE